ncbi:MULTISPECIES: ParM/StbA family protein [Pseudomonas syringae group]|uniref:Uncharacterized protein n=1 Tax=Pseudomonas cannabina TaxID=86840 RepID=A0A3M3LRZ4_PSECA|nr:MULTISPECIES: ParM/StbA family protein [Pseudomonas syringae group]MDH4602442.1 ParM/StbA family protein [Pseudomonas syringae pv. papulans]RMN37393.1 hypothetical protein ALQ64_01972 [Pseudomonas cannabina]
MASKEKTPQHFLVADDNGYADHKFAWFGENKEILVGKIASIIQQGGQPLSDTLGNRIGAYAISGQTFICSSAVNAPLEIRTADYPTSVPNRVLVNHGLRTFGLLGKSVALAVTLPFRDFYKEDGTIDNDLRTRTAENFKQNDVEIVDVEGKAEIVEVQVFAEAMSAWFDWAIKDDGSMSKDYESMAEMIGKMLVVDIGGSTTDLACLQLVDGTLAIDHSKSGSKKIGVLDAKEKLGELIRAEMQANGVQGMTGHDSVVPQQLINVVMEKGKVYWAGKEWDFTEQRDKASEEVTDQISSYLRTKAGNTTQYFRILVVGGGALVFQQMLSKVFQNATFSDEFANARGALKYLRDKMSSQA